jgi:hypothetical protein
VIKIMLWVSWLPGTRVRVGNPLEERW